MREDDESIGGCTAFGWGNSINNSTGSSIDTGTIVDGTVTCQQLSVTC